MAALRQVFEAMRHEDAVDFMREMSRHERAAFTELAQMCRLVADTADAVEDEWQDAVREGKTDPVEEEEF